MACYRLSDDGSTAADYLSKGKITLAKMLIGEGARMVEPISALVKGVQRPRIDGIQWGLEILEEMGKEGARIVKPGFCI